MRAKASFSDEELRYIGPAAKPDHPLWTDAMSMGLTAKDVILVAEDNATMRTLIVRMLRSAFAARIVEASNGEEAARLLLRLPVTLVVTDLEMEPVDGLELLKRIRSGRYGPPDVPVLMLTGHTSERTVRAAAAENVSAFLVKPVAPPALIGRIRALATQHRLDRAASASHDALPHAALAGMAATDAAVFDLGLE